jgi:hypothetical protein
MKGRDKDDMRPGGVNLWKMGSTGQGDKVGNGIGLALQPRDHDFPGSTRQSALSFLSRCDYRAAFDMREACPVLPPGVHAAPQTATIRTPGLMTGARVFLEQPSWQRRSRAT